MLGFAMNDKQLNMAVSAGIYALVFLSFALTIFLLIKIQRSDQMKQGKIWGETYPVHKEKSASVHVIRMKPHSWSSEHKHERRANKFHCITGVLTVRQWPGEYDLVDDTVLAAGQSCEVPPGRWHQMRNDSDQPVIALEIYTAEVKDCDIERRNVGGIDESRDAPKPEAMELSDATALPCLECGKMPVVITDERRTVPRDFFGCPCSPERWVGMLNTDKPAVVRLWNACTKKEVYSNGVRLCPECNLPPAWHWAKVAKWWWYGCVGCWRTGAVEGEGDSDVAAWNRFVEQWEEKNG